MMHVKGVINVKYGGDVVNRPATREGLHSCILWYWTLRIGVFFFFFSSEPALTLGEAS